jgi:hypothetical protein
MEGGIELCCPLIRWGLSKLGGVSVLCTMYRLYRAKLHLVSEFQDLW